MSELIELSNALAQVTDHAAAYVVAIHAEARGSSSGVVWREGIIVTAEHALRREIDLFCELFIRPTVMAALKKFVEDSGPMPYLP